MSILSQVTHNLKCPQDIPSLLIFSSQFMVHLQLQYPQVIAIPLDFLVSIHGQLATPNIRKILPSLLIFWSQFMVHLQPSGSPRPLFPLSTGHFLYSPANSLHRALLVLSCQFCFLIFSFHAVFLLSLSLPWFVSSKLFSSSSNSLLSTYRFIQIVPNA